MKIIIIRHGDPDYEKDSLTEKGWREVELLADKMEKIHVDEFFVSPLGRAKDTANATLKRVNAKAKTCRWLREFNAPVVLDGQKRGPWDFYPSFIDANPDLLDREKWYKTPVMKSGNVISEYRKVTKEFDKVLKANGYERKGTIYKAVEPNTKTLVFFCHFGVECVLVSHLINTSPVCLWQGMCAAPTSVTTLISEEREQGKAFFRCSSFGDISHLYAANEEPAFAARFCETYDNKEQRH